MRAGEIYSETVCVRLCYLIRISSRVGYHLYSNVKTRHAGEYLSPRKWSILKKERGLSHELSGIPVERRPHDLLKEGCCFFC